MTWNVNTDKKINELFKKNNEFRKRLLSHDADAIRELATYDKGFSCEEIIYAYENDSLDYIYAQAKRKLEITKLYFELIGEVRPKTLIKENK